MEIQSKFAADRTSGQAPAAASRVSTRRAGSTGNALFMRGALALLIVGLAAVQASAATQYVANTGNDAGGCGAAANPCRTISKAVTAAAAGDKIVVLPGVYGDVDGDGEFVSLGDEPASYDTGCNCLIDVDKPVAIVSRDGAGATSIRGAADGLVTVAISAPGASLGARRQGFSVVGDPQGDGFGVRLNDAASAARIEGNAFSRLENAVYAVADNVIVKGNRISQIAGNGIHAEGQSNRILQNVVEQTGSMGASDSAIHVVGRGAAGHVVRGNLVVGNYGLGIYVDNGGGGATSQPHVVSGNLIAGNALPGVKVVLSSGSGGASVNANSIYNNDTVDNCGLMSLSAGPAIDATNNFWGAAGGPGGDPKDAVCSVGTSPDTGAPAVSEFVVVAPPLR